MENGIPGAALLTLDLSLMLSEYLRYFVRNRLYFLDTRGTGVDCIENQLLTRSRPEKVVGWRRRREDERVISAGEDAGGDAKGSCEFRCHSRDGYYFLI